MTIKITIRNEDAAVPLPELPPRMVVVFTEDAPHKPGPFVAPVARTEVARLKGGESHEVWIHDHRRLVVEEQ